jgi:hypothetical protein
VPKTYKGENIVSLINGFEKTGYHIKKNEYGLFTSPNKKMKLKW